jgi:Glycosyl transferases group 1
VLALPSHTEGLPNAVLEACAANVPVVATKAGGTVEVVEDGVNGFLVPIGDTEAMAGRLIDMLADENRRSDMGLVGRQRVVEQFSFSAQADLYCQLFEEVCSTKPAPAAPPPPQDPEPDFPPEYGDPVGTTTPTEGEEETPEEMTLTPEEVAKRTPCGV